MTNQNESIPSSIVFIGDTHFGHKGIIEMCNRPFSNLGSMNRYMIRRWNETVNTISTVYFLGDMAYGKKAGAASTWKHKLNGDIIHITGNHDKSSDGVPFLIQEWHGYNFLLIHNPAVELFPFSWDGWVIHSHKHNNDLENFPFINFEKRSINVSVEVIAYRPVSLSFLIDTIRKGVAVKSL